MWCVVRPLEIIPETTTRNSQVLSRSRRHSFGPCCQRIGHVILRYLIWMICTTHIDWMYICPIRRHAHTHTITLHHITSRCMTLHDITVHYISFPYYILQYITIYYMSLNTHTCTYLLIPTHTDTYRYRNTLTHTP